MSHSSDLRCLFNAFSRHYYLADVLSFGQSARLRKKLISNIPITKNCTVLDLMCGTGNNLNSIPADCNYYGYDYAAHMISLAGKTHKHRQTARFETIDVLRPDIKFPESNYILCTFGLKCISQEDYDTFAQTIYKSLGDKGSFFLLDFQFPEKTGFKLLLKFYLNTVCRLTSLIVCGNTKPVTCLLKTLDREINLSRLETAFQKTKTSLCIEKKLNSSLIFIKGTVKKHVSSSARSEEEKLLQF